jgi:hypothetical protein
MENNIELDKMPIATIPEAQEEPSQNITFNRKLPSSKYLALFVLLAVVGAGLIIGMLYLNNSRDNRSEASSDKTETAINAGGGPEISINPNEKQLIAGETISFEVKVDTHNDTISVVKLQLSYDPSVIEITGYANGSILPIVLSPANFSQGKIDTTIAVNPESPFKGSGVIGTLSAKVLSSKASSLSFTDQTAVASLTKLTNSLAKIQGSTLTEKVAEVQQPPVKEFSYGATNDIPITGNWFGGKIDMPAIVRGDDWHLKKSQSEGVADLTINVITNSTEKKYYLACDWTGNGTKTPAIVSNGIWSIKTTNSSGQPDLVFTYGTPTDIPVCGNWTGRADGVQTVGIFRDGTWYLRNSNSDGFADIQYSFGNPGDIPITGHWTGTKQDFPGVYRDNTFHLRNSHTQGIADAKIEFGIPGDTPIVGDWTGTGTSMVGVVRGNKWFLKNK